MFDFDAGKLMIIASVALVVIGPKDLPRVLRQLGQMVTRVKRMAGDFQNQFMDAMKEADIQELRDEVAKLKDTAKLDVDFDPAREIKTQLDQAMSTPVLLPRSGSTSEHQSYNLASPSEIEPEASIAGAGIGPAVDVSALPEPDASPAIAAPEAEPAGVVAVESPAASGPEVSRLPARKAIVVRRRVGSRFDTAGGRPPAWQRSRNIFPARRETPDQ